MVLPEKPKLKLLNKGPNVQKPIKEPRKLRDIQGPTKAGNSFRDGQFGIVVSGFNTYWKCCVNWTEAFFKECSYKIVWIFFILFIIYSVIEERYFIDRKSNVFSSSLFFVYTHLNLIISSEKSLDWLILVFLFVFQWLGHGWGLLALGSSRDDSSDY